jgi:competence protein ComEC
VPIPAALPALSILAGTAAACFLTLTSVVPAILCLVALAAAVAAFCTGRRSALVAALAVSFGAGGWSLGARAFREAEFPPLVAALGDRLSSARLVALAGRLRTDALGAAGGVTLDIDVESLDGLRWPAGGVRLSVAGSLAPGLLHDWRAGRRIRVSALLRQPSRWRDPGVADSRLDLARRGIVLAGGAKSGALVEVASRGTWLEERAADLRAFARRSIDHHVGRWSRRSAAIVVAILIGDRAGLDDEVQQRLREAGTYHVIAISGGNIAILAGLLMLLFRLARVPQRPACWVTLAGLAGYAWLVGGGPSVVRATLMAAGYLAARQADHRGPPLNALATSSAVIVLVTPTAICDVAFALTFGATLGILVGARAAWIPAGPTWLRPATALLAASLSAELALFPIGALAFSRVTVAGLLLNFAAIPLMTVAQVAGMSLLPLAACGAERLAAVAGWVAHAGAAGLVESASLLDVAPWLSWRLPPPAPATVATYYLCWCGSLFAAGTVEATTRRRALRLARRLSAAGVVVSGLWILVEPVTLCLPGVAGRLRVTMLDVGHADCVLVQLPDRRSLLVDAAGSVTGGSFDIGGRVVAPALWALGTRRLDALVISHGDPDHVGGAASVLRDFRPREVWEGVPVPTSVAMAALKEQARRQGAVWRTCRAGDTVPLGDVAIHVWHPPEPDWERRKVRNDDSLVLEVRYREVSLVLPGDAGAGVERQLAPSVPPAPLRILKVPHHGSATSSSPEFLAVLRPAVALISAAATTKVADAVLERYHDVGTTVLRTSDDGAITVTTDGTALEVTTFAGRRLVFGRTTQDTKGTKTTASGTRSQ